MELFSNAFVDRPSSNAWSTRVTRTRMALPSGTSSLPAPTWASPSARCIPLRFSTPLMPSDKSFQPNQALCCQAPLRSTTLGLSRSTTTFPWASNAGLVLMGSSPCLSTSRTLAQRRLRPPKTSLLHAPHRMRRRLWSSPTLWLLRKARHVLVMAQTLPPFPVCNSCLQLCSKAPLSSRLQLFPRPALLLSSLSCPLTPSERKVRTATRQPHWPTTSQLLPAELICRPPYHLQLRALAPTRPPFARSWLSPRAPAGACRWQTFHRAPMISVLLHVLTPSLLDTRLQAAPRLVAVRRLFRTSVPAQALLRCLHLFFKCLHPFVRCLPM